MEALPPLVACFAECTQPVILVGLADLLLEHPDEAISQETLARLLREVKDLDLFRYLAAALLAAGNADLRQMVLATANGAHGTLDAAKQEVLLDVLSEAGEAEDVRAAVVTLRVRRGGKRRR